MSENKDVASQNAKKVSDIVRQVDKMD